MSLQAPDAPRRGPIAKLLAVILGVICVVGFIPIGAQIIDKPFIISQSWYEHAHGLGWKIALAVGIIGTFVVIYFQRTDPTKKSGVGVVILLLLTMPLLLGVCAYSAIVLAYPLSVAVVSGEPVQLEYVVRDDGPGTRRCRGQVYLENMPPVFDQLCGVPDAVRSRISQGSNIAVQGQGTEMGVFYETILY